jgi:hypothetical protein
VANLLQWFAKESKPPRQAISYQRSAAIVALLLGVFGGLGRDRTE